jgi:hypothetical protein
MIRLLLFTLVRFFVFAASIYFVLMLVRGVVRAFKGQSHPISNIPPSEAPPEKKEVYKDVRDASFTELKEEDEEQKSVT